MDEQDAEIGSGDHAVSIEIRGTGVAPLHEEQSEVGTTNGAITVEVTGAAGGIALVRNAVPVVVDGGRVVGAVEHLLQRGEPQPDPRLVDESALTDLKARYDSPVSELMSPDVETVDRAKRTEPMGYLVKPFERHELWSAIEVALYKHRTEAKLRALEHQLVRH